MDLTSQAAELARQVSFATTGTSNEFQLHQAIEGYLEQACKELGISWVAFSVNVSLIGSDKQRRFADAVHGAVIIEYKRPKSFRGRDGNVLQEAKAQAEEYAKLMEAEEGRSIEKYVLIAWDGGHINFGQIIDGRGQWESLQDFNSTQAQGLLKLLQDDGRPLVHPLVLSQLVGPESETGASLIPLFYNALVQATEDDAPTTKTKLLFTEWNRLFGQVIGMQSTQLNNLLRIQASTHQTDYNQNIPQYIFALNTHIALVAKLVAALSLPNPETNVADATVDLENRLQSLEDGSLFRDAGVVNILSGDFFTWYLDGSSWHAVRPGIEKLLIELQRIDFNVQRKELSSVRDLFKGNVRNLHAQSASTRPRRILHTRLACGPRARHVGVGTARPTVGPHLRYRDVHP